MTHGLPTGGSAFSISAFRLSAFAGNGPQLHQQNNQK
jgi:hypothetical protein